AEDLRRSWNRRANYGASKRERFQGRQIVGAKERRGDKRQRPTAQRHKSSTVDETETENPVLERELTHHTLDITQIALVGPGQDQVDRVSIGVEAPQGMQQQD